MLKIYGYSYCGEDQYGIGCGVVIAENETEAVALIASANNRIDVTIEDIQYVQSNYSFKEIPYQKGDYNIGSYFE